jgi:hypothetical protein
LSPSKSINYYFFLFLFSQQGWKKRGSESWEDKVGEEIEVEDWREELGGGQTEPVRSQVREKSSGEGSVGGRDTDFEGSLSLARRI